MPNGNGNVRRARVKRRVEVRLDLPALSTNKLFSGRKRRSYHYKVFRKRAFEMLNERLKDTYRLNGNLKLTMEVGFSSKLSDLSNSIKAIEDILCEYLGFNDRQIVEIVLKKWIVPKGSEYMDITVSKCRKNIDLRRRGC